MNEDRIVREVLIEAPLARVWSMVVEPGFWVAEEGTTTGTVASVGDQVMVKNPQFGEFPVRVEKIQPPTYAAYRWTSSFPGQELREDNSTLVEFTLSEEGDKTLLRVVESGFAALAAPQEHRDEALKNNTSGWPEVLNAVKRRVERASV